MAARRLDGSPPRWMAARRLDGRPPLISRILVTITSVSSRFA
jgi:hypothetical protein